MKDKCITPSLNYPGLNHPGTCTTSRGCDIRRASATCATLLYYLHIYPRLCNIINLTCFADRTNSRSNNPLPVNNRHKYPEAYTSISNLRFQSFGASHQTKKSSEKKAPR